VRADGGGHVSASIVHHRLPRCRPGRYGWWGSRSRDAALVGCDVHHSGTGRIERSIAARVILGDIWPGVSTPPMTSIGCGDIFFRSVVSKFHVSCKFDRNAGKAFCALCNYGGRAESMRNASAFAPTFPSPIIRTFPDGTPASPGGSTPLPPVLCFCRHHAPGLHREPAGDGGMGARIGGCRRPCRRSSKAMNVGRLPAPHRGAPARAEILEAEDRLSLVAVGTPVSCSSLT